MVRTSVARTLAVGVVLSVVSMSAGEGPRDSLGSSPASLKPLPLAPSHREGGVSAREVRDARLLAFGGERAVMRPRRDATLAFGFAADIEAVLVQGGQAVKKGEALVKAWDGDVLAAVELQRTLAQSTVEIDAAEAELAQAQIELESVKAAFEGAAATSIEWQRRENAVHRAEAARDLAQRRQVERSQELAQREAQASRYTLKAAFDGVVDLLSVSEGQSVDRAQGVVRVVDIERLHIDVAVRAAETLRLALKPNDLAWVMFEADTSAKVRSARVLQVSPVADASSGRRLVRVELDNEEGWPAGMLCRVRFEEPVPVVNGGDAHE